MWTLLLLAATVRSFAHLLLGISDRISYILFSEEICNEYAALTMSFQSQVFPTEKNPEKARFCLAFFDFQKMPKAFKKARISKSSFKKAKLAILIISGEMLCTPTQCHTYFCDIWRHWSENKSQLIQFCWTTTKIVTEMRSLKNFGCLLHRP